MNTNRREYLDALRKIYVDAEKSLLANAGSGDPFGVEGIRRATLALFGVRDIEYVIAGGPYAGDDPPAPEQIPQRALAAEAATAIAKPALPRRALLPVTMLRADRVREAFTATMHDVSFAELTDDTLAVHAATPLGSAVLDALVSISGEEKRVRTSPEPARWVALRSDGSVADQDEDKNALKDRLAKAGELGFEIMYVPTKE